jgi:hypothetical protein
MVFDTTGHSASAWDESLTPAGFGTAQKEPFESWEQRNQRALAHLHPAISEQWIYRHWTSSPYKNLPIEGLTWRQESWETNKILEQVFRRWPSGPLQPEFDYKTFHGKAVEPALTMDRTGSWNYPIVILETPDGVRTSSTVLPNVTHCLIEGHQRVRYLNALRSRGECADKHLLFILTSPAAAKSPP